MSATLLPEVRKRFLDADGNALNGGKVYTYVAGTTTPKATYTDSTQVASNTNPIILNNLGEADIWINGNYKINVTDADDVQVAGFPVDNVQDLHTADNVTATSTTSLSVSAASKTFTTQTGKYFPVGIFLLVVDDAAPSTNWMHGQVTSYSGTQLVINVTTATGSGTHADWTISLSGPVGPQGSTGSPGAGTGDVVGPASVTTSRIALFDGTSGKLIKQHTSGAGSAAGYDVGTSAGQVVVLDGSAKLPAVDGSQLTNTGTPVVTGGASGKIVFGAVTFQWGHSSSSSVTFGTALSGDPTSVIFTLTVSGGGVQSTSVSATGFTANGGATAFYWLAIGPT